MRNTLAVTRGAFALTLIGVGVMLNIDNLLIFALAIGLAIAVVVLALGNIRKGHLFAEAVFSMARAWSGQRTQPLGATTTGLLACLLFGMGAVISGTPGSSTQVTCLQAIAVGAATLHLMVEAARNSNGVRPSFPLGNPVERLLATIGILVAVPLSGRFSLGGQSLGKPPRFWLGSISGGALDVRN